ncbi:LysR family transcriptional regulator [Sorangium sp. So ce131]|uniref:LysR family transcriptional regulator n=1 Tax=Sorangium sp. So ce131 TaxID=3133282 RepID=UPI003F63E147
MSWDDLRYLLALSREGSLAGAGRALGVDHTTVGRRVEALEAALGVRLFVRSPSGYALTSEGLSLIPDVARVEEVILAIERGSLGRDQRLSGTVRVTAAEAFGSRFLAPRLGALHAAHPGISIELVTSIRALDLSRREADIAVRFFRSAEGGLVVRKAGVVGWAAYAARGYIERRGAPTAADLPAHARIGIEAPGAMPPEHVWFERMAAGGPCVFRSNSTACMLGAARAGLGVALLPCFIGDLEPDLARVALPDEPRRAVWLTVHRDLQHAPRVRAVLDAIARTLAEERAVLSGDARDARDARPAPPSREGPGEGGSAPEAARKNRKTKEKRR